MLELLLLEVGLPKTHEDGVVGVDVVEGVGATRAVCPIHDVTWRRRGCLTSCSPPRWWSWQGKDGARWTALLSHGEGDRMAIMEVLKLHPGEVPGEAP